MAEGKEYEAVAVTAEDGKNTESFEATRKESKQNSERSTQEDIELIQVVGEQKSAADSERPVRKKASLLMRVGWEWDEYDDIKRKVTAKTLMNDEENPLLLAIKVIEKLHERADKKEPNEDDFIDLANRVEEFTLRFLDPLKDQKRWREAFAMNPKTDVILETAIKLGQKKFFDHPIVIGLMNERWRGDRRVAFISSKPWWLFLNLWCLFDIVLFPLSFFSFLVLGWIAVRVRCLRSLFQRRLFYVGDEEFKSTTLYERYKDVFTLPYFIFVRDTLSYLALLGLHLAICVEPSQLAFSRLELAISVFLFGRLLMETKQVSRLVRSEGSKGLRNYFRDRWNYFDLATLVIFFFAILPLRIVTWLDSNSVMNNRALQIAGFLYGFNTMLLTIRAFGSILETFEGVGTIQIALFHIIRDAVVVVLHFGAITLAFSSTITKVFVAETSLIEGDGKEDPMCNTSGIICWWKITIHLGLSVLQLSDGLSFYKSADSLSQTIAHLLYAAYLVVALILLINMLIALLSNTYQRVQDNSRNEWAFQKAVTIQTYSNYHPIPVPFNIISTIVMCAFGFRKKAADEAEIKREQHSSLTMVVTDLQHKYRLKYGDSFPPTYKLDQVLDDAENTESMVNQLLHKTFEHQNGCDKALLPTGPKAWETSRHICIEGYLLTATNYGSAMYLTAFSHRFPHFEVLILESGVTKWLALGVVFQDYTQMLPGRAQGTVGYHTGERTICSTDADGALNKQDAKGPVACRRGDVVRCTVLFEDQKAMEGQVQVPVVFTVNGSRVIPEGDHTLIEYSPDRQLYPQIGFYYENSVLAKMCPREDVDYQDLQMQQLNSDLAEVKSELADVCNHLMSAKEGMGRHEVKSDLALVHEDLQLQGVKLELAQVKSELSEVKKSLEEKLDAVLAMLGGKDVNA